MRIPKQEDFAVLFMSELGRIYPGRLPVSTVARQHGVSDLFLKKIVRQLKLARLIKSKEGVDGGYILAKNPGNISVWDIITAVNGKSADQSKLKGSLCPLTPECLPQQIKRTISESLEKSLDSISLSQFTK